MSDDFDISQEETGFPLLLHISEAHARCLRPTSSAWMASTYDSQRKWEKSVYYIWNMEIYLIKNTWIATGDIIHPPEPCEAHFITNARILFHVFWTVDKKHPLTQL